MIALDIQPFNIVNDVGFRELLTFLAPDYTIPSRGTVRARVDVLMSELRVNIQKELCDVRYVTITTDTWTSCNTESYIAITAHYSTNEFEISNRILGVIAMPERHTGINLAERILDEMALWRITEKVKFVVHDNACNMSAAVDHIDGVSSIHCSAHTLQLAINSGLSNPTISDIVKKASATVTYFNHSTVASNELKRWQKQLSLPEVKLIQSVKTRWNSVYFMLQRLLQQKVAVEQVINDNNSTPVARAIAMEISAAEWRIISDLISILEPLQISTTVLCGETTVTASTVCPIVTSLVERFLASNPSDSKVIADFKQTVASDITARFKIGSDLLSNNPLAMSSLLDPRYKSLSFVSKRCREFVMNNALQEMRDIARGTVEEGLVPCQTSLDFLLGDGKGSRFVVNDPFVLNNLEMERYMAEPELDNNDCPLLWWKNNRRRYESLSVLAMKYLTIPATSVPSERVFSCCGNVVTDKRSRLSSDNVSSLVFLNYNFSKKC